MRPDVADFYSGLSFDAYCLLGAHPAGEGRGWLFTVYAPHARRVQVLGDWNGWNLYRAEELAACEDGLWRGRAPAAVCGQLYKYNILCADGAWRLRSDPFAFGFEALPGTASRLVLPQYTFTDGAWLQGRSAQHDAPVNIYELHAASWRRHWDGRYYTYAELGDALLPYLAENNFTHVEFMPMAEYPFDGSWGYQCSGYFAPSARFGSFAGFAALVDRLHAANIGVIMDFVPVHFAPDDGRLANFDGTPLFERAGAAGQSSWGSCNFDLGKSEVRSFLLSAAAFWLHVCHCDGLRVDAIGSALYSENGGWQAAEFFKTLSAGLHARCPGCMLIAEDTAGALNATAATWQGGLGFDYVWDIAWAAETLNYFAAPPQSRPQLFARLAAALNSGQNAVNALSHDDNARRTGTIFYRLYGDEGAKLAAARLLYLYQFCRPGKKLNFMGGELAAYHAFDPYRELDWGMLCTPAHRAFADYFAALCAFYRAHPALYAESRALPLCADAQAGLLAFARSGGGETLLCVLNTGSAPLCGYGLDIRPLGSITSAAPVFAAGAVSSAAIYASGGRLPLTLPACAAAVYTLSPPC